MNKLLTKDSPYLPTYPELYIRMSSAIAMSLSIFIVMSSWYTQKIGHYYINYSRGQYKVYVPFSLYDRTTEAISVLDVVLRYIVERYVLRCQRRLALKSKHLLR